MVMINGRNDNSSHAQIQTQTQMQKQQSSQSQQRYIVILVVLAIVAIQLIIYYSENNTNPKTATNSHKKNGNNIIIDQQQGLQYHNDRENDNENNEEYYPTIRTKNVMNGLQQQQKLKEQFGIRSTNSTINNNENKIPFNVKKSTSYVIHQTFYFNSIINMKRKEFMEHWLSQQGIDHRRIERVRGKSDGICSTSKICKRRVELSSSYRRMLDPWWGYDTFRGVTMMIHDDNVAVQDIDSLKKYLWDELPETWNVVRLDCNRSPTKRPNAIWYKQAEADDFMDSSSADDEDDNDTEKTNGTNVNVNENGNDDDFTLLPACVHSKVVIYRPNGFQLLRDTLNADTDDIDCLLGQGPFETYCINTGLVYVEKSLQASKHNKQYHHRTTAAEYSWTFDVQGVLLSDIEQEAKNKGRYPWNGLYQLDRIYYNNLKKNALRRNYMNDWLSRLPPRRPIYAGSGNNDDDDDTDSKNKMEEYIPYKQIDAQVGLPDVCVPHKNTPKRCRGISGVAKSLTSIIDNENTTGITLVLEDDIAPVDVDLRRLFASFRLVPEDWDIVRYDCWGYFNFHFNRVNQYVFDTSSYTKNDMCYTKGDENCDVFCGGAYAMIWRDRSVSKLRAMWNQQPVDDVDCIIGQTSTVKSYCVNIGIFDHISFTSELSDVSMLVGE